MLDAQILDEAKKLVGAKTCSEVANQELLQGIRDDATFRTVQDIRQAGDMVENPLKREVFAEAVDLHRVARREGPVRSAVDCVIAACAIRHNLIVLHHGLDYGKLAGVSVLPTRRTTHRLTCPCPAGRIRA